MGEADKLREKVSSPLFSIFPHEECQSSPSFFMHALATSLGYLCASPVLHLVYPSFSNFLLQFIHRSIQPFPALRERTWGLRVTSKIFVKCSCGIS